MKPRSRHYREDPAGIGLEIALKAAADAAVTSVCEPLLYGPSSPEAIERFTPGPVTPQAGRAAFDAIVRAVNDAIRG